MATKKKMKLEEISHALKHTPHVVGLVRVVNVEVGRIAGTHTAVLPKKFTTI